MGMSMSMGLSMRLAVSQRMELRQELAQKMGVELEILLQEGGASPDRYYDGMVERVKNAIDEPELAAYIESCLRAKEIRAGLLKEANHKMASIPKDQQQFIMLVADCIYDSCHGSFAFAEGEEGKVRTYETTRGMYTKVFTDRTMVEKGIADTEENIRLMPEKIGDGALQEMREAQNALTIHESLQTQVEGVAKALYFASSVKDKNGTPPFQEFFRDWMIMKRLLPVLSVRIQKRFANRFAQVGKNDKPEEHATAMMNSIGEYVLVSMGIVAPELFDLKKNEVDQATYEDAKEDLGEAGIDLDAIMDKYKLHKQGVYFWNRWAVRGQKTNNETDNKVRNFLSETMSLERDRILKAINFDDMVQRIQTEIPNGTTTEMRQDRHDKLRELLVETLSSEKCHTTLVDMIRTTWYPGLMQFVRDRKAS